MRAVQRDQSGREGLPFLSVAIPTLAHLIQKWGLLKDTRGSRMTGSLEKKAGNMGQNPGC